jgi:hypothetical protein
MIVTRREIADSIEGAFEDGPASRDQLLAAARDAGARQEVVAELERLPERSFSHLRALWRDLPDIPVSTPNN